MERRRERRVKRRLTCEFFHGFTSHRGIILDLGPTGLFIRTNAVLSPGTEIDIHLAASVAAPAMTLRGCVVRRRSVPATLTTLIQPGVGVRILDAPREFGLITSDCELDEAIQTDYDFSQAPDGDQSAGTPLAGPSSDESAPPRGAQPTASSGERERSPQPPPQADTAPEREAPRAPEKTASDSARPTAKKGEKRAKKDEARDARPDRRKEARRPARPLSAVLVGGPSLDPIAAMLRDMGVETIECGPYDPQLTALDDASLLVVSGEIAMSDPIPVDTDRLVGIAVCGDISETMRSQIRQQGFRYLLRSHLHPEALRLLLRYAVYAERDRRGRVRHPVGCEVSWRTGWKSHRGWLLDVSREGCCLLVEESPDVGDRIGIKIPAETVGGKPLKLKGKVLRSTQNAAHSGRERTALGVLLEGTTDAARKTLAELCERWSEGPPELSRAEHAHLATLTTNSREEKVAASKPHAETSQVHADPPSPVNDPNRVEHVEHASPIQDSDRASPVKDPNHVEHIGHANPVQEADRASRVRDPNHVEYMGPAKPIHGAERVDSEGASRHAQSTPETVRESPTTSVAQESARNTTQRSTHRGVFEREVVEIDEQSRVVQALLGRDLSIDGVRVVRQLGLEPGSKLRIALFDTPQQEPLILSAEVSRDDFGSGLFLRFVDVTTEARTRIEGILAQLPAIESIDPHGDAQVVAAGVASNEA